MNPSIGTNRLLDAWDAGHVTIGLWCAIPSSVSAEGGASQGFDYVCVDQQHGAVDYPDMVTMFQAIDPWAPPLTRIPWNDPGTIMKALDAGAKGVIVPLVSTVEDAQQAVSACRFPPTGVRSYGPVRASLALGSRDPGDLDRVACVVMVETREGLANLEDIAAVPGLDAIYVGPADLALALDLPPAYERSDPEHVEAIEKVRDACTRRGIVAGIHCADGDMAARRIQQGFQMVTVANDLVLVKAGAAAALSTARAAVGTDAQRS